MFGKNVLKTFCALEIGFTDAFSGCETPKKILRKKSMMI